MINDVYLYFSDDITSVKASTTTADQDVTISDGAPFANMPVTAITVADAAAGKGWLHNGMAKLTMDAAHNDGSGDVHLFGTHYGTVADDQADIEIHPNAITYAEGTGDGDITLATVAADPVYGVTQSSTAGENGFKLHLLKPYESGATDTHVVKPASTLVDIQVADATTSRLLFAPTTHDTAAFDMIVITHASGKFNVISKAVADLVCDPRQQGKLIMFMDGFNQKYHPSLSEAGITAVTSTLDT